MKFTKTLLLCICLLSSSALSVIARKHVPTRPRILISTDIGGTDPGDNQSMAHLLMYCNEFDIEGLGVSRKLMVINFTERDKMFTFGYGK